MPNILIIDDDEVFLLVLRVALELGGHEVLEAPNGRVGMDLFREKKPDLIITDILMPERDGFETIMELRKSYPDVKIIAISGGRSNITVDLLEYAKILGAQLTIAKPIKPEELLRAVEQMLSEESHSPSRKA